MPFNIFEFEGYFKDLVKDNNSLTKSELKTILGLRNAQKWMQCTLATRIREEAEREKEEQKQNIECEKTEKVGSSSNRMGSCMGNRVSDIHTIPNGPSDEASKGRDSNAKANDIESESMRCEVLPSYDDRGISSRDLQTVAATTGSVEEEGEIQSSRNHMEISERNEDTIPADPERSSALADQCSAHDSGSEICESNFSDTDMAEDGGDKLLIPSGHDCFPPSCCIPSLVQIKTWLGAAVPRQALEFNRASKCAADMLRSS
jgi:hypothetical protein